MGAVYRAEGPDGAVAIKLLYPQYSDDESYVARFRRESAITSELDHPNIVTLLESGEDEQLGCYQVMRLVEGESLRQRLEEGPLPPSEAVSLMLQLLEGLAYAHQGDIVHRDIKPDNLLLEPTGRLVITDFGVALAPNRTHLTRTGLLPGTPDYMSPEQLGQEEVGPSSDLYAAGIVMYELLTGRTPFACDNVAEVIQRQVYQLPRPPSYHTIDLSPALDAWVLKALEKKPGDRFANAEQMGSCLKTVDLSGPPPPKSRPRSEVAKKSVIEPTVMVETVERSTPIALTWWLIPTSLFLLTLIPAARVWQRLEVQPYWYRAGTGSLPVPARHQLLWSLAVHGCEVGLTISNGGLSSRDQALLAADRLAQRLPQPEELRLVEKDSTLILQDENGTEFLRIGPELASELERPPRQLASYWMALLQDHLALRHGRAPVHTRNFEKEHPWRPDESGPRGPLFERVYQRCRHLIREGPIPSEMVLEAIDSLPADQRSNFRQAARSVPVDPGGKS